MAKMSEPAMPEILRLDAGGEGMRRRWQPDGVEGTRTIAPDDLGPRAKILHRKTERIKFNGTEIVRGELTHGYEILNYARRNENIF